jgi:hypothetical protein
MKKLLLVVVGLGLIGLVGTPLMMMSPARTPDQTVCGSGAAVVGASRVDAIGQWTGEQLANAAAIIDAGAHLEGITRRDQTIAIMTAMGESHLVNIGYGDWETGGVTNPDGTPTSSVGLFQQQKWWGTYEERMTPSIAATLFYQVLLRVPDRDTLDPGKAAFAVQIGGSPSYYNGYWDDAQQVINGLTCSMEWVLPARGPITSPYGSRVDPFTGVLTLHDGVDLWGGGCDEPIRAAHAGTVGYVGFDNLGNGIIRIDHSPDVETVYVHMWDPHALVTVNQVVSAGQVIATIGSSGTSTGCHLHFMVRVNGSTVDPVVYLADQGVPITS